MRIGQRHLSNQVALRGPDVHRRAVFVPRKFVSDCHIRAVADAALEALFQCASECTRGSIMRINSSRSFSVGTAITFTLFMCGIAI
jgi:hypothetical protein